MKLKIFILFILLSVLCSYNLYAQKAQGPESNIILIYNTGTVETILWHVRSIENIYSLNNTSYDIIMNIYTSNGEILVHLGPAEYLEEQSIKINIDDNVTVTGSKINYEGKIIIIAEIVTVGGKQLKLRNDYGDPLWLGQRIKSD